MTTSFQFTKDELFQALEKFAGKVRTSLIGMYKAANREKDEFKKRDILYSIWRFLQKNNLCKWKLSSSEGRVELVVVIE